MRSTRIALAAVVLSSFVATAQQYIISTYAGGAPQPTPAPAADVPVGSVSGIAADTVGNVYFTSPEDLDCVFKLDQNGVLTRVAGNSRPGYSGDGGPATSAQLNVPTAIAVDSAGNLFILDSYNVRIRKVSTNGIITTVAGDGQIGPLEQYGGASGNGGPATSANLNNPAAVAVDRAGNLFIAEPRLNRIRRVSTDGIIATVAGNGIQGFSGDGGTATSAELNLPAGVAVDAAGDLFIADTFNRCVRMVSPNGIISTVAQDVSAGNVATDAAGNLYITDISFARIFEISGAGAPRVVAGNGTRDFSGDGGPATSAALYFPTGVAVDSAGNLFIADSINNRIRKVSTSGIITTATGNQNTCCYSGDGGPAIAAQLNRPSGLAADSGGNLFIVDAGNSRVRKVSSGGIITTLAEDGAEGVAVDGADNVFIADGKTVRKVSPNGTVTPVAGISGPLAVDAAGNLFIADFVNGLIRMVSPDGKIKIVAGNGTLGFSGDGGPAISAQLANPTGVAVDGAGNIFIADWGNVRTRKVSTDGTITTLLDGGSEGVAVDGAGNVLIAGAGRLRKVSPDGSLTIVAGGGPCCYSGDGGPAATAQLGTPAAVAVDKAGNVYIADANEHDFPNLNLGDNAVRILQLVNSSVLIGAVLDAASQSADLFSPGQIVVIYGADLGPAQLIQNQASSGQFGNELSGATVSFNGIAAPVLYASATQVAATVPYAISGSAAKVVVTYQGQSSPAFNIPVALSAPSIFTSNQTGAGQAAAVNADGTVNTATNPVKIGGYISLYATGEGQTAPGGVDGELGGSTATHPLLPVSVTIGGIPATVQYAGSAPGQVAGLMQINVQIPSSVQPGGYVPVVLQVGDASTTPGAVWIAVSGN